MRILRTGKCNKENSKFKIQNSKLRNFNIGNLQFAIWNSGKAGFTLLELIVVIFILSLFVGLIVPSFYGISEGRLKSDAGKIASTLRYLNDTSISRKETVSLKIDIDRKILRWNIPEGEKEERFGSLYEISTSSTGDISRGEATLFFGPLGLKENLTVKLREDDKEIVVSFNPMSGRVKVIEK
jgi:prepilin-type N-terminal cleavage/methylation domain-containing protein